MSSPDTSVQWSALQAHAKAMEVQSIADLFAADDRRMDWALVEGAGIALDFSKNRMSKETLGLLCNLAEVSDVAGWRSKLFNGDTVNITEGRAALHMALRGNLDPTPNIDGQDISSEVAALKARLVNFVGQVHKGEFASSSGKPFKHVVNIGIGGSDLGPRLVCDALQEYWSGHITPHFVANVDGTELVRVLDQVDPETTLFIIASKSFTTQETMRNAETAKAWVEAQLGADADISRHFVGVTANQEAAKAFGLSSDTIFGFWDWVGGRYSVWSAVGLVGMLALGADRWEAFLAGAAEMDQHFLNAPIDQNLPILLALIGVWNHNLLGLSSHAVLPYAQALALFPSYLQQLDMESNGKSSTKDGGKVLTKTAPLIWGAAGTNGQHAFYQWLHQGTDLASADIILPLSAAQDLADHQEILVSHAIAQAEALAFGRSEAATKAELVAEGLNGSEIDQNLPHRAFEGDRPVSTLLLDKLSPRRLGALLALYEHKAFAQSVIWDVNSFDQWGVELGKTLASRVLKAVTSNGSLDGFDPSTAAQITSARIERARQQAEFSEKESDAS